MDTFLPPMKPRVALAKGKEATLTPLGAGTWREDLDRLSRSGDYFFSLNRYLFMATKR